jgi:hypothetical protein
VLQWVSSGTKAGCRWAEGGWQGVEDVYGIAGCSPGRQWQAAEGGVVQQGVITF